MRHWSLRIVVPTDRAELLSVELVLAGALAVGEETDGNDTTLIAGFDDEPTAHQAASTFGDYAPELHSSEPDWVEQQRAGIEPTHAGPWFVRAPWHDPCGDSSLTEIVIDPGSSFGHGGHPTTTLLLELLPSTIGLGDRVTDVGSGSGILGIAAGKLGAQVNCLEVDDEAVGIASENIVANEVGDLVSVTKADVTDEFQSNPTAMVNLTIDLQEQAARSLQDTPTLLISGILDEQLPRLRQMFPTHRVGSSLRSQGWVALTLHKWQG